MNDDRFQHFSLLIHSISKSMQRLKKQNMEKYHLSAAHTNCLARLGRAGEAGLTQRQLMDLEQMDRAQVSRVLRDLEKKEYVEASGNNTYRQSYRLTPKGMPVAEEVQKLIASFQEAVSGDIPPDRLIQLYAALETIASNLNRL